MKRTIIAMSANYWGRGDTIADAMKALKEAGGTTARGKMILIDAPHGAWVNELGDIRWRGRSKKVHYLDRKGNRLPDSQAV